MARAFVTGGSGFVGRALIGALSARGDEVRALARSASAEAAVRAAGAEAARGDLDDAGALREGMKGCEVVYHSAAYVKDWGPRSEFFRANVAGTEHVIAAARASGVQRLVFIGTEAVLAGGPPIRNADEAWPYAKEPAGLYPLTKAISEEAVLSANSANLVTISVRPRFIWGKGDSSVLPQLVERVKKRQWVWIDGGHYLTSTCHVDNVCEGAILASERGRGGQAYFLTDGAPIEFRTFITDMLRTQGLDARGPNVPRKVLEPIARASEALWSKLPLPGAPPLTRMAIELMGREVTVNDAKARRELGYVGKVSIAEGLAAMRA